MYPLFLFKIVCYTCRPFTITLASSAYICAGHCLILKWLYHLVKRVDVLHDLVHVIGSGRFHNHFFKSVDSLGVIH